LHTWIIVAACVVGVFSQYAQRPTDQVLWNRSIPGRTAYTLPVEREGIDGYLAVAECERIGEVVTVSWRGRTERLMVFDCAGDGRTRSWMKRGNILGELDYYTAKRWGVLGRGVPGAWLCRTGASFD
jgi:hypothetical protein